MQILKKSCQECEHAWFKVPQGLVCQKCGYSSVLYSCEIHAYVATASKCHAMACLCCMSLSLLSSRKLMNLSDGFSWQAGKLLQIKISAVDAVRRSQRVSVFLKWMPQNVFFDVSNCWILQNSSAKYLADCIGSPDFHLHLLCFITDASNGLWIYHCFNCALVMLATNIYVLVSWCCLLWFLEYMFLYKVMC